ncbi:MAG: transporter, partial [Zoogloeaceae bacterium]|nr:transporter [Zoogloeaceae bacterium]
MKPYSLAARLAAALCLVAALGGCFGVALTGAVGGALSVADRRSFGAQTDDTAIEVKAASRLPKDIKDCCHLNFTSFNRRVLITGEV